jgi:hypothetical protein
MIINTYPMGDQQPTPTFVRNFYEAFQEFLRQNSERFDSPHEAVTALMEEHGIQAAVCFQRITFNELEPDYYYPYLIFGWPTAEDQQAFIDRFDGERESRLMH